MEPSRGGRGSYLDYIDIGALIDFHISGEMATDWEMIVLNGRFAHFDPKIGKLKMGPLWDFDDMWGDPDNRKPFPGFFQQTPFWYKELLGYEITSSKQGSYPLEYEPNTAQIKAPRNHDPYYVERLKARWGEVNGKLSTELDPYITATNNRFNRITGFSQAGSTCNGNTNYNFNTTPLAFTTSQGITNYYHRLYYIQHIVNQRNALTTVFNGY